ncbi:MAG: phosphate signaling complex protein PhoU [Thermodesulfobacteriota bacterium]|jgi:phosphate transport system protein
MSRHLRNGIENLKARIIDMAGIIEDRVFLATLSVIGRDAYKAEAVKNGDGEIDQMEVDFEEECLKLLALHQPVSIDLRIIVAMLKINNDLERIGDLAVNIAERGAFLAIQEKIDIPFELEKMVYLAEEMLTGSIDALVSMDVVHARKIRAMDDRMDGMYRDMYGKVKEIILQQPRHINVLLHAMSVGRYLERIADLATNIAEDVIYMISAEIVRHSPEIFEE